MAFFCKDTKKKRFSACKSRFFYVFLRIINHVEANNYLPLHKHTKTMKKLLYSVAILGAMAVVFASCKKDRNNEPKGLTITAQVENGNQYNSIIKRVRAMAYDTLGNNQTLVSSAFANGGFSFTLPATVDGQFLFPFDDEDMDGFEISDKNAKTNSVEFEGFSSSEGGFDYSHWEGNFILGKIHDLIDRDTFFLAGGTMATYIYSDRDVTVSGKIHESDDDGFFSITLDIITNLSLKKGWNRVYSVEEVEMSLTEDGLAMAMRITLTTTPVSGLKWYFADDFFNQLGSKLKKNAGKSFEDIRQISRSKNPFFRARAKR